MAAKDGRASTHRRQKLRAILKREQMPCHLCGAPIDYDNSSSWDADHIIPLSEGGTTTRNNLRAACRSCNRARQDRSVDEYIEAGTESHNAWIARRWPRESRITTALRHHEYVYARAGEIGLKQYERDYADGCPLMPSAYPRIPQPEDMQPTGSIPPQV